jgi:hypothetical protein
MANKKQHGTLGKISIKGQLTDCVYVIWHTRDPRKTWFVNAKSKDGFFRCRLKSLIDRRPHEVNSGFTQDAWSYEIIDEDTFLQIQRGGVPIPPRDL